jgi:hypothetical protein
VGLEIRRFTGELCIQGRIKGSNDIDRLMLHNKRTKFTCGPSTSRKEPNDIMGYQLKSKPFIKVV